MKEDELIDVAFHAVGEKWEKSEYIIYNEEDARGFLVHEILTILSTNKDYYGIETSQVHLEMGLPRNTRKRACDIVIYNDKGGNKANLFAEVKSTAGSTMKAYKKISQDTLKVSEKIYEENAATTCVPPNVIIFVSEKDGTGFKSQKKRDGMVAEIKKDIRELQIIFRAKTKDNAIIKDVVIKAWVREYGEVKL